MRSIETQFDAHKLMCASNNASIVSCVRKRVVVCVNQMRVSKHVFDVIIRERIVNFNNVFDLCSRIDCDEKFIVQFVRAKLIIMRVEHFVYERTIIFVCVNVANFRYVIERIICAYVIAFIHMID